MKDTKWITIEEAMKKYGLSKGGIRYVAMKYGVEMKAALFPLKEGRFKGRHHRYVMLDALSLDKAMKSRLEVK